MSSLDSLMIQGIRTFSPDKPQVIKFYPITLILGHNGAGKTTIIECLRYITSGEFPPNTYKGKTWIHDPSLIRKKVKCVRSQVKLKFNDVYKNCPVATKNVELVVSHDRSGNTKTSIRTLDFAIKVTDQKSGEVKSLVSTKCAEVESLMLDHLGVSKAVLTNVIFCHQEESNWPLSESKQLKEKFDQIFGLTGYVKALKKIKDMRKSYMDNVRLIKKDLIYLEELKEQFEKLEIEKKTQQDQLDCLLEKEQRCEREVLPVRRKLDHILNQEQEMGKLSEQIARTSGLLEAEVKAADQLKIRIADIFDGSIDDLEAYLDRFQEKLKSKAARNEEFGVLLSQIEQQIVDKRSQLEQHQDTQNDWLLSKREFDSLNDKLNRFLQQTSVDLNVDYELSAGDHSDNNVRQQIERVRSCLKQQTNDVQHQIQSLEEELKTREQSIGKSKNRVVFGQQSISMGSENLKKLQYDVDTIRLQLSESATADNRLEMFEEDCKALKSLLETQIEKINIGRLDEEIREAKANKSRLAQQENDLMDRYKQAQKTREISNRIADLQTESEDKQSGISKILLKHREFADKLQNARRDPQFSFLDEVKRRIDKLTNRLNDYRTQKNQADRRLMLLESDLNTRRQSIRKQESLITSNESEISKVIGFDCDVSNAIERTKSQLDESKAKLHQCSFKRQMLTRLIPMIPDESRCLVCDADLKDALKKRQVVQKLKFNLDRLPADDLELETQTDQLERKLISLKELLMLENQTKNAKRKLEEEQAELHRLQMSSLPNEQQQVQDVARKCDLVDQECKVFHEMVADAQKFDDLTGQLRELTSKVNRLKSELSACGGSLSQIGCSSDQIEFDLNSLREQLTDTEHLIDKLGKKKQIGYEQIEQTKSRLLKVEQEKVMLEKTQQAKSRLRDELRLKTEEIENVQSDNERKQQALSIDQTELNREEKIKSDLSDQLKRLTGKREEVTFKQREFESKVGDLLESIRLLRNKFDLTEFESMQQDFERKQAELELLRSHRTKAETKMKDSRRLLEEAKTEERDLIDNLEYLKCRQRIEALQQSQSELQVRLGAEDISSLMQLKQKLQNELQTLEQNRQVAISCRAPTQSRLNDVVCSMKADKYKDIHNNYNRKLLDLQLQTIVSEDLNKYYVALDKSVIIFHQRKMEEINILIYRFWKQTYRGNDIETIRIVSEEEQISSADARKSYNYRVVMVKAGIEMDMRGRCSAGQKVLACLIIRLALAEIFCVNCGVLALDEPTTNLDKQSILSFSESIRELMESHRKYKNFQLIIITHDEEFLRCLDDENDYYYKITQDDEGHSCIEKHSIRDRD